MATFSPKVVINNLGFALMSWNSGEFNSGAMNFSKKEIGFNTFDPPSAVAKRAVAANFQHNLALNNSFKCVSGWDAALQNQVNQQGDFLFLDLDFDYFLNSSFFSFSTIYPIELEPKIKLSSSPKVESEAKWFYSMKSG